MRSLKLSFLFIGVLLLTFSFRKPVPAKVQWLSLQQAADSVRANPKPILIDLYTEWCGWCKVMDKKTYANKQVSDYIKKHFYPVKIDAESKNAINYNGKKYLFNATYRTNDFAMYLTNGQLSYPTTVIIPVGNGYPQAIPGYLEPKDFEMILKYFGENKFGQISFADYQRTFKPSWK